MTTDIFCLYLQNRLIQTGQTGGQWYSDASPFSIPWSHNKKITTRFPDGHLDGGAGDERVVSRNGARPGEGRRDFGGRRSGNGGKNRIRFQCYKTFYGRNLRLFLIS
jgi:hypothetical protein